LEFFSKALYVSVTRPSKNIFASYVRQLRSKTRSNYFHPFHDTKRQVESLYKAKMQYVVSSLTTPAAFIISVNLQPKCLLANQNEINPQIF
jgi:hypothetical protein